MHDAVRVRARERRRQLARRARPRRPTTAAPPCAISSRSVRPSMNSRRDVQLAVDFFERVDGADAGMRERRGGARFAAQPLALGRRRATSCGASALSATVAPEPRVRREIDASHSAAARARARSCRCPPCAPAASASSSSSRSGATSSAGRARNAPGARMMREQRQRPRRGPPDRPPPRATRTSWPRRPASRRARPRTARATRRCCCDGVIDAVRPARGTATRAPAPSAASASPATCRAPRRFPRRSARRNTAARRSAPARRSTCFEARQRLVERRQHRLGIGAPPRAQSVKDTRLRPAHRFCAPRARARSTRIWRIDRAAMPTKCRWSCHGVPASASRR